MAKDEHTLHQGDDVVVIENAREATQPLPPHHPDAERKITLSEIEAIERALLIGLESFGEVERVIDKFEMKEMCGHAPNREMRPLHPTGSPETIGWFATALRICNSVRTYA